MKKIISVILILAVTFSLGMTAVAYDFDYRGTFNIINNTEGDVYISDRQIGSRQDVSNIFVCKKGGEIIKDLWEYTGSTPKKFRDNYWTSPNGYRLKSGETVRLDFDFDINMTGFGHDSGWAELGFYFGDDCYIREEFNGKVRSLVPFWSFNLSTIEKYGKEKGIYDVEEVEHKASMAIDTTVDVNLYYSESSGYSVQFI